MKVSYMITSHNRREELLKGLEAIRQQAYADKEVHVVDDGSSDGTYEAVREMFPEVILTRNDPNLGSVASRNQIFGRATGDILIGLDDDSRFIDSGSTSRIVDRFKREPDLGLIDCQDIGPERPHRIDPGGSGRLRGERHVSAFACSRYALRRKALERVGLFPSFFWHAYEEPDLAIRLWDAGYRCLAWYDIIIWHEYSGLNRNECRTHFFHARNELLSCLMRTPASYLAPLLLWRMASQLRYSFGRGWWTVEPRVWWEAFRMAPTAWRQRRPVRAETLRRCLLLNRRRVSDAEAVWDLGTIGRSRVRQALPVA